MLGPVESQNKKEATSISSLAPQQQSTPIQPKKEVSKAGDPKWFKEQSSNQSVKDLRLKIKKINSYSNIEISPILNFPFVNLN